MEFIQSPGNLVRRKCGAMLLAVGFAVMCAVPAFARACESGHWVKSIQADGKIVVLEDGSVWEIDDSDVSDSATWLQTAEVVVCDDKLINTDDNETVEATRIK